MRPVVRAACSNGDARATLLAALVALAAATHADAQPLVKDLAGFKAIPAPEGVECRDEAGARECELKQTAGGKEYTFFAAFLETPIEGETRRAFAIGVSPYGAATMPAMERLYKHYAVVLALNETQSLVTVIPSLAELPELCAKSPSARKSGEDCLLVARESVVRSAPGNDDRSGLVVTRQWIVK